MLIICTAQSSTSSIEHTHGPLTLWHACLPSGAEAGGGQLPAEHRAPEVAAGGGVRAAEADRDGGAGEGEAPAAGDQPVLQTLGVNWCCGL